MGHPGEKTSVTPDRIRIPQADPHAWHFWRTGFTTVRNPLTQSGSGTLVAEYHDIALALVFFRIRVNSKRLLVLKGRVLSGEMAASTVVPYTQRHHHKRP